MDRALGDPAAVRAKLEAESPEFDDHVPAPHDVRHRPEPVASEQVAASA